MGLIGVEGRDKILQPAKDALVRLIPSGYREAIHTMMRRAYDDAGVQEQKSLSDASKFHA